MQKHILPLILIIALMTNCDTTKKTTEIDNTTNQEMMDSQKIIGTSWKLIALDGKVVTANPDQKQDIHFVLQEDGKVTGFAGCNTINGNYTLEEGNRIRFSEMATTRMMCPNLAVNEFDFLKVFEQADNYTVNGNRLMLNVGKRAPLAAFMKNSLSTEDITEKKWKLKTLNGKTVTMTAHQEKEIHFILKKEGNRVVGYSGCNGFSGNYKFGEGNRLSFDEILSTLMACPGTEVNESQFLNVFQVADNYTINGNLLMLNVGKRAPLAVFEVVQF